MVPPNHCPSGGTADAKDLKSFGGNSVPVRVRSWAPKKTKIEPFRLYAVEEICRKKVKDNERETHCLFSVSVACIGYLTNSIFILPLLQLAVSSFSPPSFDAGKLQSPFLMLQEIEKSSQPPIIVPAMFPFFCGQIDCLSRAYPFAYNVAAVRVKTDMPRKRQI